MQVTLKGQPLELEGNQPVTGEKAVNFSLVDLNDSTVELSDLLAKPLVISVVPDIDTSVCAIQTNRFNQEAASMEEINFVTISNNSKEQQSNWCASEGVDMMMLRDTDLAFGKGYGLYIPEINHLARAIFVINQEGVVAYEEIVPEIAQEPDYTKAIEAAKTLI